jgi:hypothetical protein
MENKSSERADDREEIFSKSVRAGKRTYFFDVKATKGNDYYLTVTESKKKFGEDGKFFFEKHKLFLYKEDFEKFAGGLREAIDFIEAEKGVYEAPENDYKEELEGVLSEGTAYSEISFDDLGSK